MKATSASAAVDLYWLPLGAGAPSGARLVRVNGIVFELIQATLERRRPLNLYHAGLEVRLGDERFVIEVAPSPDDVGARRGVVANGPVGTRLAGHLRLFRYELHCWAGGAIPDIDQAVDSPIRLTTDAEIARRVLELAPSVPTVVWGRDELGAGEMWTSNSVISWLLLRSGLPADHIRLPAGGRAPGWDAGIVVARRSRGGTTPSSAATIHARRPSRWRSERALRRRGNRVLGEPSGGDGLVHPPVEHRDDTVGPR
jgi:hypothetical protein